MLAFFRQGGGVSVSGTANFQNCEITSNEASSDVSTAIRTLPAPFIQRPAGTLHVLAFLWQGGGVQVSTGGKANFNNCTMSQTIARIVSARILNLLDSSSSAPLERYMIAFFWQGGGVFVDSNAEANFQNCEITSNEADDVSTAI